MSLLLPTLPVSQILPELLTALASAPDIVLQAPTGAGKTTLVPLALLDAPWLAGQKILMLEPRRLAARAAARRMAGLLGEPVGQRVGYRVQLESKVSATTRIEVVTEGILLRQLQNDPELAGVGLVIFDEFHERSLAADLGLALSEQCQQFYRDERPLKRLVMSATLDTEALGHFLQAPVVISEGRSYPVTEHYRERPLASFNRVQLCQAVAETIRLALSDSDGSVLVFLPGVAEIRKVAEALHLPENITVCPLYGDLGTTEQDLAIQPASAGLRKVVLATAIAESSLTIEGVTQVVDAGLMRQPRFDPRTGLTRLETVRVSKASADQRRGRAGRLQPGRCFRLWTETEQSQLQAKTAPEICSADLTPLALELYAWGAAGPEEFSWQDAPPKPAWGRGEALLQQLGALELGSAGALRLTEQGRRMAGLGVHPRLARMLLCAGADQPLACDLAALLQERDLLNFPAGANCVDIQLRLLALRGEPVVGAGVHRGALYRVRQHSRQLQRRLGGKPGAQRPLEASVVARLLGLAYPDRIAQRRGQAYRLANGQGAELDSTDPLADEEWLVVASLGGRKEQKSARVFLACAVEPETLWTDFADQLTEAEQLHWEPSTQRVCAEREVRLGALVLKREPLPAPDSEAITRCLLQELSKRGLQLLNWTPAARQLSLRLAFMQRFNTELTEPFPDCSEAGLSARVEEWLGPFVGGCRRLEQLSKLDLIPALRAQLSWPQQQLLQRWAPERLEVPSGSQVTIDYSDPAQPVLAARLQELFGLTQTPEIAEGRMPLLLHLLSPARRPVQVTKDLASFWSNTYPEVKKDLKGRYPKHYWPDDPFTAVATRHVRPR